MTKPIRFFSLALAGALCLALLTAAGCGEGGGGGGSDDSGCAQLAGLWESTGSCGPATCTITQQGCDAQVDCIASPVGGDGSVDGNAFSFSDTNPEGTCDATFDGARTLTGTCTVTGGPTCSFTAVRR